MKRRLLYILIGLVTLLVLVVVVTQIVLWTDIPRRIVVGQVESQLGLDVEINSLSTGWFGNTVVKGLEVRLPLAGDEAEPLLEAGRVVVDHNSLLGLLWTRALELDGLKIEGGKRGAGAVLRVREGADGRWNVQDLAELLQARLLKDDGTPDKGPPHLPRVALSGVRVEVERQGREVVVLNDVTVKGEPVAGGVAYEASAVVPGVAQLKALRLAVGEPWEHEAAFVVEPGSDVLAGLGLPLGGGGEDTAAEADAADEPGPVRVVGSWRGRFAEGVVTGRLELERAATPWAVVAGPVGVRVETQGGIRVKAEPAGVVVTDVMGLGALGGGDEGARTVGVGPDASLEDSLSVGVEREEGDTGGVLRVTQGVLTFDVDSLVAAAEGVRLTGLNGAAAVEGRFDLRAMAGTGEARWQGIQLPTGFVHRGEASATLGQTVLGGPAVEAKLTQATLASPLGDWSAAGRVVMSGRSWAQLSGEARVSRFTWEQGSNAWELPETAVDLAYDGGAGTVALTRLRFEDAQGPQTLDGRASVNLATREWNIDASSSAIDLPMTGVDLSRVEIHASGDAQRAVLAEGTRIRLDPFLVEASGEVAYGVKGVPVDMRVALKEAPLAVGEVAGRPVVAVDMVRGEAHLWGLLNEPDVDLQSELVVQGLRVWGQAVGDINLAVLGNATSVVVDASGGGGASENVEPRKAILARVSADAVEWLGGQWQLHGAWAQAHRLDWDVRAERWSVAQLDPEAMRIAVYVDAGGIDLTEAQRLVPGVEGVRDGSLLDLDLLAVSDSLDLASARVERGRFEIKDFAYSVIDTRLITGDIAIDRGAVVIPNLEVTQEREGGGEGRVTGEVRLSTLDDPRELALKDVVISQWELATPEEVHVVASGRVPTMRLDLTPFPEDAPKPDVPIKGVGEVRELVVALGLLDKVSRRFRIEAALEGQTFVLRELKSELPEGSIDGEGRFDLQDVLQSQALFVWQGLPLDDLRKLDRRLGEAQGLVSGRAEMRQTDDPRARGTTVIEARLESDAARYGEIPLGIAGGGAEPAGTAKVFLERVALTSQDGRAGSAVRAVLYPVTLQVSGGRVTLRGRVSPRYAPLGADTLTGFERFATVDIDANGIQMGPITRTFRPEETPIEGIVGLRVSASSPLPLRSDGISTDVSDWRKAGGRGRLTLEQSDLASIPLFSQLFQLLNLKIGDKEPEGTGEFNFRIERGIVIIEQSEYRNFGSELKFFGRVEDIFRGLDSPISGLALASTSPLPELKALDAVNDALRSFQGGLLSVELDGTLNEPKIKSRALEGFFGSVDRVLTGRERDAEGTVPAVGDTPLRQAEDRALEDVNVRRPVIDPDRTRTPTRSGDPAALDAPKTLDRSTDEAAERAAQE